MDLLHSINLHTSNTEAFFPQATYNQDAFNKDGSLKCEEFPGYAIMTHHGANWTKLK